MSLSESSTYTPDIPSQPVTKTTDTIHIELTPNDLDSLAATRFVRSPSAGATVLFIGTTRDSFNDKAVSSLSYTSYAPLAMATLYKIASSPFTLLLFPLTQLNAYVDDVELLTKHSLTRIAIIHKLGDCPIGEESIVIAVSAKHRKAAWLAGEEALEETKDKAEIWKLERFEGGEGVWRANRDGAVGVKVEEEPRTEV
jgi:molybdopterin synthase catalytic subunit